MFRKYRLAPNFLKSRWPAAQWMLLSRVTATSLRRACIATVGHGADSQCCSSYIRQCTTAAGYVSQASLAAVICRQLLAPQHKASLQRSAMTSAGELYSDRLLRRACCIRAWAAMRVQLMPCASRSCVLALLYILLVLQAMQGIGAIKITVDVRRCRQHLAAYYFSDPLATWPCSYRGKTLNTAKTAVVVVDMWDFHHCPSEDCDVLLLVNWWLHCASHLMLCCYHE